MPKYSFEFKKKIVEAYFRGEGGYTYLAEKYGVKNRRQVLNWVHYYEELGDDGLRCSREKKTYSFEFKLHVVELYLSHALISKWVNDFKIAGPDALRPRKRGRKKSMNSKKEHASETQRVDVAPIDTSAEHVKQLEDELLKLRIENAYLKELRRLRLEEEALLRKQRELSTASEEDLN